MRVYISWTDTIGGFLNGENSFIVFRSVGEIQARWENALCWVSPYSDGIIYSWTTRGWYITPLNNATGLRMESHNNLNTETQGETFEISYNETNEGQTFNYSVAGAEQTNDSSNPWILTPLATSNPIEITDYTYSQYHP
jgi:hypothetical protein